MKVCSVEGCKRKHHALGYCFSHWQVLRPLAACSVEGCQTPARIAGMCKKHIKQHRAANPPVEVMVVPASELPTWAKPIPTHKATMCDCGAVAIATFSDMVGTPTMSHLNNRRANIDIAVCADCLQSERYNRREITYRRLCELEEAV